MAIHLRRTGEVADGSVTTIKLADGAVTGVKINDRAVTSDKIAELAVIEEKIADNAVTAAKAVDALRRHVYVGDETEVSVNGTVETVIKSFSIAKKNQPLLNWKTLHCQCMIKSGNITHTASLKIYIDNELSPRIVLDTTSTTYDLLYGNTDIGDLSCGKHDITVKIASDNAGGAAWNELIDVFCEI